MAAEKTTTNPAERLLRAICSYKEQCKRIPGGTMAAAWCNVFGCSDSDTILIYARLAELLNLANDVEQTIIRIPEVPHEKYLKAFQQLKSGLMPRTIDNPHAQGSTFDSGLEARLEFCSELLEKEIVLEEPTLAELKLAVEQLFDDIERSKISPSLKRVLLDLAESMRRSIADYFIRGVKGMKEAFGITLLELMIHHGEIDAEQDGPWKQSLGKVCKAFSDGIASAANMTTLIAFSPRATEFVYQALPFLKL